jgi:ABC-type nickel/cobalt efflux system permease component RcnA
VAIGAIGIATGLAVAGLEAFEGVRGQVAGWLLLGFGLAYFVWGVRRAIRNRPHTHVHSHADGAIHSHVHGHAGEHAHVHADDDESATSMTPWVLFTIFVLGPCEPLIPILMFPAAKMSLWGVLTVTLIFCVCTLATMTAVVLAGYVGASKLPLPGLARYSHALAGFAIATCGAAIQLGL